ncbi:MAG: putative transcriptional regulator [Natronomonas sp.]|jgi:predicted transcriptional regulator
MLIPNVRRLLAVLAALAVICSALGAPVAAAATATDTADGVSGTFGSDDGETSTNDGGDDTSSDDGSDSSERETIESISDTVDDTLEIDNETLEIDNGSVEVTPETLENADGEADTSNGSLDGVETVDLNIYPGDDVESTTDTTGVVVGLVGATMTATTGSVTGTTAETSTTVTATTESVTGTTAETSTTVTLDTTAPAEESDQANTVPLSAGGSGGQPLPAPSAPAGGAAVGLGVLAAAAGLRSTSMMAGLGVGSPAVSSGLLSSLLDKVKPFFFLLRYSRHDDSDPLEHEAREQVYEIVNDEPGSYLSEVSEEADLPLSTARHHIKVLEREGLVSGTKLRGKRRYYPAYAEGIELAAALNDEATASIIDAIARLGAASVSDLADELGRDPSTISHHLQRLETDDIITRERDGRAVMNTLSAEARTALEPESTPKPGEASGALAGGAD